MCWPGQPWRADAAEAGRRPNDRGARHHASLSPKRNGHGRGWRPIGRDSSPHSRWRSHRQSGGRHQDQLAIGGQPIQAPARLRLPRAHAPPDRSSHSRPDQDREEDAPRRRRINAAHGARSSRPASIGDSGTEARDQSKLASAPEVLWARDLVVARRTFADCRVGSSIWSRLFHA